jgi:hypothetical protein
MHFQSIDPLFASVPMPDSTIDFGPVVQGNVSTTPSTIVIRNNAAYGMLNVSTTFSSSWFAITSSMPINNLVKPSTHNITIVCNPPAASPYGMHIETLTLATNDATQATINFTLACNGTGPVFASTNARQYNQQWVDRITTNNMRNSAP